MDSPKKKNQTPIHSKSLNQIRNFGPYCPLQPAVDDRRSDFSKSVHSGTKTLSPFLLTRTVVFSFLLLRFLWVDEVFFYLVKAFIAQKITLIKSIFSPTVYHYTNLCFGRKYTMLRVYVSLLSQLVGPTSCGSHQLVRGRKHTPVTWCTSSYFGHKICLQLVYQSNLFLFTSKKTSFF